MDQTVIDAIVGRVMAEMRAEKSALEATIATLRTEVAETRAQLAEKAEALAKDAVSQGDVAGIIENAARDTVDAIQPQMREFIAAEVTKLRDDFEKELEHVAGIIPDVSRFALFEGVSAETANIRKCLDELAAKAAAQGAALREEIKNSVGAIDARVTEVRDATPSVAGLADMAELDALNERLKHLEEQTTNETLAAAIRLEAVEKSVAAIQVPSLDGYVTERDLLNTLGDYASFEGQKALSARYVELDASVKDLAAKIVDDVTALGAEVTNLAKSVEAVEQRPEPAPATGIAGAKLVGKDLEIALTDGTTTVLADFKPQDGAKGDKGEKGDTGTGLAGALIDREGRLVVTLSNGEVKELGAVVGRDGNDGDDGKDGVDGLGFEHMEAEYDGERTLEIKFTRGDVVKSFPLNMPVMIYRDVFKSGQAYDENDAVTYGGSLWVAKRATEKAPGDGSPDWRLAVKRGRDGNRGAKI
ncbi:putative portal protein [Rhizobium phage RHph_X2_26]|nr:putative portal protein [Rhizobium phage RHph_X2_26]